MKYPDYRRCKEIAVETAKNIPESIICGGLFFPLKGAEIDERWSSRMEKGIPYTHIWVLANGFYIDNARTQFGEPNSDKIPVSDPRYILTDFYNATRQEYLSMVEYPKVQWETESNGRIVVVWPEFDQYKQTLSAQGIQIL